MTYEDLVNTTPDQNTGNVEENKSLYWHPTVYSYDRNTDKYTRDVMAQTSAYYIWENGVGTKAFPNGFKMIAGLDPEDASNFPSASAECVNPSPCEKEDCTTENTFFPAEACSELEVSMTMPTCWDGRLDSSDHVSHVHYTLDGELDGECPDSHPMRLPQIRLFFRIMPYDGGWHTFSDGSSVFHTDYISGWDENFLQNVLDNCVTDSFAANPNSFCEDFVTFRDGPKCTDENSCDFADPGLLQKLQEIQPPPVDVTATVTDEETEIVVGSLPRGTCNGNLLPGDGVGPSPTPSPVVPPNPTSTPETSNPTPNPTPRPTGNPTTRPTPSPEDNSAMEHCFEDCWDTFHVCENDSDTTCEGFYDECTGSCYAAVEEDELDIDDLDECINVWCYEDVPSCHERGDRRCLRRRNRCIQNCELIV